MSAWRLSSAIACIACLVVSIGASPSMVAAAVVNGRTIELVTGAWPRAAMKEGARISGDGTLVAFSAQANESPFAAPGSTGLQGYAKDLVTGDLEQISVDSDEQGFITEARIGGISPDGRFVTFSGFHAGIVNSDVYVRDRLLGTTELVSVAGDGGASDGYTQLGRADISADGRYVVFSSTATNLIPDEVNSGQGIYLRDRALGTTARLDVREDGSFNLYGGEDPEISDDGSTVIFVSADLLDDATDGAWNVYAFDRATMTLEVVSQSTAGENANGMSFACSMDITSDGRMVAFGSDASNLVLDDTNGSGDIFVRDRSAGTTIRANLTDDDEEITGDFYGLPGVPSISEDGTKVAFVSIGQITSNEPTYAFQVYLRDLVAGTTTLISASATGVGGDSDSGYCLNAQGTDMDDAGNVIAFNSLASDIADPHDPIPGWMDVFVSSIAPADDGDGIADDVDTDPDTASSSFSDGSTSGEVINVPPGLSVSIEDASDAADGIRVSVTGSGAGDVELFVCGETVLVPAGGDAVITCGSVIVEVAPGSPPVRVVIGDGLAVIAIPAGTSAKVSTGPGGAFDVQNVIGGTVTVTVDGVSTSVGPGHELSGSAWDFQGFAAPIDNGGTINIATAGRVLPLRWHLVGPGGQPVTDLASARLTVTSLSCSLGVTTDLVEEYAVGESGLLNLNHGTYQVNWKTPKSYGGSCKTLHLDIGDGVLHDATIKFSK